MTFKNYLQIFTSNKYKIAAVCAFILFCLIFSFLKSRGQKEEGDFYIFWQAGADFLNGSALYHADHGPMFFIYPQFAAFLFQLLAIFPIKLSAQLFFLFNTLILMPLSGYFLIKTCLNYGVSIKRAKIAVGVAFLLSFQYWWNNLTMSQVNFLLFFVTIIGLYYISKNQPHYAIIFFTIATFIKIIPLFFLLFIFLFYRSYKIILYGAATALLCLALPALQRGFQQTVNDYTEYYTVFLNDYQKGKVLTPPANHTLKAGILKMAYPETVNALINPDDYKEALKIANYILLALLILLATAVILESITSKKISLEILASIYLFSHLASGMTWTAHLVTSIFFLLPFLLIYNKSLSGPKRIIYYIVFIVLVFQAIEGSDTTGRYLYNLVREYDIYVFVPFCLFLFYMFLSLRKSISAIRKRKEENFQDTLQVVSYKDRN